MCRHRGMGIERDVLSEARALGVRLSAGAPVRWLSPRGHLDPLVQREAPAEVLETLDEVHRVLGGDRLALARKHTGELRPDLVIASTGQIVEVDELQHFTGARQTTLQRYATGCSLGFSINDYRTLIDSWRARAEAVFTRRWSPDFDFAGGRRAQRAYADALLDLLAPVFTGLAVVRLPAPDANVATAVGHLVAVAA